MPLPSGSSCTLKPEYILEDPLLSSKTFRLNFLFSFFERYIFGVILTVGYDNEVIKRYESGNFAVEGT